MIETVYIRCNFLYLLSTRSVVKIKIQYLTRISINDNVAISLTLCFIKL
jgi:hypothetical protein